MTMQVQHNARARQFELVLPEGTALCTYRLSGDVLVLQHTEVPATLQGRGVGALVARAALDWAAAQGLRVRPSCSYVAAYMQRHPETHALLETPGAPP